MIFTQTNGYPSLILGQAGKKPVLAGLFGGRWSTQEFLLATLPMMCELYNYAQELCNDFGNITTGFYHRISDWPN